MDPIVVTIVGVFLALALALVWPDSRVEEGIRDVESSAHESDVSSGGVNPDSTLEASRINPFGSSSSQAIDSDNEVQAFAKEERIVAPESARTSVGGDSPKKPRAPLGDLAISGRVLNRAGAPVPGIEVTATADRVFDQDKGEEVRTRDYRYTTTSGYDGAYDFQQLASGQHYIRAAETEQYAQTRISVHAGVDYADLVLTAHRDLRVHGVVSTASGERLAMVQVQPTTQPGQAVTTGRDGQYAFVMKALENAPILSVRASRQGYKGQTIGLNVAEADAGNELQANIVMEPDSKAAVGAVSGTVRSSQDGVVAGQRIQLYSGKVRYSTTTGKDGKFVMEGVEVSDDYSLSIIAAGVYEDYFQGNLRVTVDGLNLAIELKVKDVGTLTGQMVDVYGKPISNFSLVLQTEKASSYNARVVGDAAGEFMVENAPAGVLRLKTKSNPYHRVEGILLSKGGEHHVLAVLDSGYDVIRGRVMDDQGGPVAVPNISLSWAHVRDGVRSTSTRNTAADAQGNFRFSQLGPGQHTVHINAPGYKPVRFTHDVAEQGPDVVVRLQDK